MRYYVLRTTSKTKNETLNEIATFAAVHKIATNTETAYNALLARESEGTTGFENGIAIPHARTKDIIAPAVVVARSNVPVDWQSLDGKPSDTFITLFIPASKAGDEHVKYLAAVSSLLVDPANLETFKKGTARSIELAVQKQLEGQAATPTTAPVTVAAIKEEAPAAPSPTEKATEPQAPKISEEATTAQQGDWYDFVAVTSCPTGVAHTNMAAEALERFAKKNNLRIKVERQAAQGVVNPISMEDMAKTDHVILAIGRNIEGRDRFGGKRLVEVGVAAPLKDAAKLWNDVREAPRYAGSAAPVQTKDKRSADDMSPLAAAAGKNEFKPGREKIYLMRSVMTGLSYMIPVVIVGGILLAFGLGIGRAALGGDVTVIGQGTAWYTIFQIGVAGINLSVVVLGGFIAQAIGGRLALAPALILSFVAQGIGQGSSNFAFFSYDTLQFGVENSNLSFFGSIAAAFLCGFAARYWTIYVTPRFPKGLKTIEPIIIVPILFTLVGWLLFAFVLYLPLYYLSYGLNKGVLALIDNDLLWIAGMIGGAMLCFDLGGPVNKIAFGTGVILISASPARPEFMGAIGAAGGVTPWGMALGWLIGAKVFKIKNLQNDEMAKESFVPAMFMGFVGIAEGAIPYTIKNPKSAIPANVVGGAVAGAISGAFLISDSAAHTGPIVYILGAVGRDGLTDYVWGLIFIAAAVAGALVTAFLFIVIELIIQKNDRGKGYTAKDIQNAELKKQGLWPRFKRVPAGAQPAPQAR